MWASFNDWGLYRDFTGTLPFLYRFSFLTTDHMEAVIKTAKAPRILRRAERTEMTKRDQT
jgi:hypothetical protein